MLAGVVIFVPSMCRGAENALLPLYSEARETLYTLVHMSCTSCVALQVS